MASKKLEALRKRLDEKNNSGYSKDKAIFPFWNLKVGGFSNVRLLPFDDAVSASFWTEKKMIPMEFIDPKDDSKLLRIQVPCMEMYNAGERCPILAPVRQMYNDAKDMEKEGDTTGSKRYKKTAGKHWLKFSAYYQGFVNKAGFTEEEEDLPENPIRIFPFRKQIHKVISESLRDDSIEFEAIPTGEWEAKDIKDLIDGSLDDETAQLVLDSTNGYDFIVRSKKIDDWANYSSSSWDLQHQSYLDDEQIEAIAQYGLHDLRALLPTKPTDEQIEVYLEMIEVSLGRLLGTDDGYWNPEWEKAGIKPWKPKSNSSKDGKDDDGGDDESSTTTTQSARSKAGSKLAERIRKETSKSNDEESGDDKQVKKTSTLSTLKNRRAKAAESETSDKDGDDSSGGGDTKNHDLAAKIKARLNNG